MKNKTITRKYIFWEKIFNYHNLHMMAYPRSIRKLVENLLKAVREINKLYRLKKKCQKQSIFLLFGNFNRRKRAHSQQLKIYKLPGNNILLFSHQIVSDFCDPHGLQHTSVLCPLPSLDLCSDLFPSSGQCYLTISVSAGLFSFTFSLFQHQGLFQGVGSLHQVVEVLGLQHQPLQ